MRHHLINLWFLLCATIYVESKATVDLNASTTNGSSVPTFDTQPLINIQNKLDAINDVLGQVDSAVQNLQEKAHTWAIFHHHIEAWNEQLKALEHKIEIIKRTQDEQQTFNNKLTGLEFTLNHVLSKVLYLSESAHSQQQPSMTPSGLKVLPANVAGSLENELLVLLRELQRSMGSGNKMRSEIVTRLNLIMHRVQKLEASGCTSDHVPANSIQPMGAGCNASQRHNQNVDQSLRTLSQQLSVMSSSLQPKEVKQLYALTKKNARTLELMTHAVVEGEAAVEKWRENQANHSQNLHNYCAAVSNELSTFTESSDLLLKRIELLVGNVSEKLNRFTNVLNNQKSNGIGTDEEVELRVNNGATEFAQSAVEIIDADEDHSVDEEDINEDDMDEDRHEMHHRNIEEFDFVQPSKISCNELTKRVDGIYKLSSPELNEDGRDFNERFCAFATEGVAWTVVQNRGPYAEQENFNRSWADYRNGFGQLDKDFWFGNEFLHQLVYREDYEMRIEMEDFEGVAVWVQYSMFRLDGERYNYNLLIGGYQGAVPDAMQYHNELDFSTYDRRNDRSVDACCSCAAGYASGWWFGSCSEANLNGVYHDTPTGHNYVGIIWEHWRGDYSLRKSRMMIRPKDAFASKELHEVYNELSEDP